MKNQKPKKEEMPRFPYDKIPYQDSDESLGQPIDYEMGNAELELGDTRHRAHHRTLREEDGAGHEP